MARGYLVSSFYLKIKNRLTNFLLQKKGRNKVRLPKIFLLKKEKCVCHKFFCRKKRACAIFFCWKEKREMDVDIETREKSTVM